MKKQDVFVILLSALVFFAIIFYIVYKPEKRETYSKVFNGISSSNVNVKLNNSNLAIIHSSKFYVNVDNEHLNVYKRNNKLYIEEETNIDSEDKNVYLYVPEDYSFDNIDVSMNSGHINGDGLNSSNLKINIVNGEVNLSNLNILNSMDVNILSGNVNLSGEVSNLALVNEGASIYFSGALFANNSIDSVNGKITLKLENKDSYKFKFNKKFKDVFIEDKKVSKLSYGYGKNIITINKNSGNVDINFVGDVSV